MRYPDACENPVQLSLAQFLHRAVELASNDEKKAEFIQFMLAGRDLQQGKECTVSVNIQQGVEVPQIEDLKFTWDFDSIIGVSHDIPYLNALSVFPVPPFSEVLKHRNHIFGNAFNEAVSF